MTTTQGKIKAIASILGLGALLVFTGCVKQHRDTAEGVDTTFAIGNIGTNIQDDDGNAVSTLDASGLYFVADDYVGCQNSNLDVGTLSDDGKVVVSLSDGRKAACVKPSVLATMTEKPKVTFFKAPVRTRFFMQTRQVVRTSGRTESPIGVKSDGNIGIRMLDIVDYKTNSPLLSAVRDRIEVRAVPGETYKVYHKITPKVLYIMKVATKDKLSHLDLPIADNLGNGEYAVPIAAVEIKLTQYRNIKNADREKTNVYRFEPVDKIKDATHISFNTADIKEIDLPKDVSKDVYPAEYFTKGQWYVSESVVDTRPGGEGFIGTYTGALDDNFRSASLVQFTRSSRGLIACNVGVDKRYAQDQKCDRSATVLTLPSTGHAFELTTASTEIEEVRILSAQAPFIKLEFDDTKSFKRTLDEIFNGLSINNRIITNENDDQLLSVEFSKDKFSYVVQRGDNGRKVMYSFLRAENRSLYEKRRHYKDDRENKFGYFVQTVSKIRSSDTVSREEDLEKDYLVQRHNPAKDIVFHFSNLTPDYKKGEDPSGLEIDYREIGRKSIEYWNTAYKAAGAPNRVVLAEDIDAPFGDIAYNTMNLIDSERGSNLLGVGPSLVDPYSGEVINANANVYIAPFREIIANEVRNYIKAKTGLLDNVSKNLPISGRTNSTLIGDMADSTLGIKDTLSSIVPDNIMQMVANFYHHGVTSFISGNVNVDEYGRNSDAVTNLYNLASFNSENSMVQNLVKISKRIPEMVTLRDRGDITFNPRSRKDLLKLQQALEAQRPTFYRSYFMSESAAASDYNTMTSQIEEQCGEVLKLVAFVNNRAEGENAPARLTTEEELPALRHCMTQVIPGKFQATLIHEIGHTLGLRHNFYASADEKNFFNKEEVKDLYNISLQDHELPKSSSTMDYVRTEQDRLTFPGHYDIAAIRYGYADSIEVESSANRPNSLAGNYVKLKQKPSVKILESFVADINNLASDVTSFNFNESDSVDEVSVKAKEALTSIGSFKSKDTLSAKLYDSLEKAIELFEEKPSSSYFKEYALEANKLFLESNKFQSVNDSLVKAGAELTPYAYCTDIAASLEIDPLCARHDFGTNPKMIVEDTINSFWESFTLYNFRYDRLRAGVTSPFRRAARMDKLKRIYTEWRVHLANHIGKTDSTGNVYLQRYTAEEYATLIESLKADPNFKGKDYLAVRDQIFDFVMDVAFFPNKYCLVETPAGAKAYEFDRLRDELKNQVPTGTKISSCEAKEMQDLITSKGFTYILEAGLPVDNLWHAVNPQDTFEEDVNFRSFRAPLDAVGTFLDRYFASTFLGGRNAGYTGLLEKMFPNMMDEPDLYLKFEQRMVQRLTQGADLKDVFSRANGISIPDNVNLTLPNFAAESALLKALWLSLEQGIRNQFVDTSNKLSKYTRVITQEADQINDANQNGGFVMPLTDGSSLVVRPEATVAFSLAQGLISVVQTFQGANQQIPTAEQLAGSLTGAVDQLAAMVDPTAEELTAEKYLEFSRNFLGFFAQVDPYQQQMLQQVFLGDILMYLVVLRDADTAIQQAEAAGQQPPAGAVQHIANTLAEWNRTGMIAAAAAVQNQIDPSKQQYNVTVPTSASLPAAYAAQSKALSEAIIGQATTEQQQRQAFLAVNGDELRAQYDLLRSILIYDFSEVQQDFGIRLAEIMGDGDVDSYKTLMSNSRSDLRAFAEKHLSPKVIAEKEFGMEFPFDKVESLYKF